MKRKLLSFLLILCLLLPYAASAQEGGSLLLEESGGISSLGSSDGLIQSRDAQISIPQLQTMTDAPVQQLQPPSHEPFDITASATAALQEPQTRAAEEFDRSTFNTITVPKIQNGAGEQKGLSSGDESISPYSGNLTLCYDDLTLPGRNGFDLTSGRTYQTSQATVGQPYVM